jgi:RNA polymerase sigma-70 factor (ECF subfamily)
MNILEKYIEQEEKIKLFIFYKTGNDKQLAEDIYQDTYIKLVGIHEKGKYREEGKFLYWIRTIVSNVIIDHYRKQNRKIRTVSNEEYKKIANITGSSNDIWDLEKFTEEEPYEDTFVTEEMSERLKEGISELSEPHQEIIKKRYYRNMSFNEVVEDTGEKLNNLLPRMHHAKKNLRKILNDNGWQDQL